MVTQLTARFIDFFNFYRASLLYGVIRWQAAEFLQNLVG